MVGTSMKMLAAALTAFAFTAPVMTGAVQAAGEWQPIEGTPPDDVFRACGTKIVVSTHTYDMEFRETTRNDGTVVYEERGTWTIDIRTKDGRTAKDVNTGGDFKAVSRPNGSLTLSFSGPSLVRGTTQADTDALAGVGLPNPFYYWHGTFIVTVQPDGSQNISRRPLHAVSVCKLLKFKSSVPFEESTTTPTGDTQRSGSRGSSYRASAVAT